MARGAPSQGSISGWRASLWRTRSPRCSACAPPVSSPETRAAAKTATTQLINVAFAAAGGFANVVNGGVAGRAPGPTPLTPREADALLVLLTLCERAAAPGG